MYALSNLIGLAVFGWLTRRARLKGVAFQERRGRRVLLAIRVGLILLGVCFLLTSSAISLWHGRCRMCS